MLTLIKREIEDAIVLVLGAVIFTAIVITVWVSCVYRGMSVLNIGSWPTAAFIFTIICCVMGIWQMRTDRTKKISSFLLTLPVTRRRILIARIITGFLVILLVLVPVTITAFVLLQRFGPPIPLYKDFFLDIFVAAFLMSFACYCIGLHNGWSSGKVVSILGSLILTGLFLPLVIIKGIGPQALVIVSLFITALLIRTWQKFMATSL